MVQIIQENRRPSTSERFSRAIGSGLQSISQTRQEQQAIEAGKQLLGMDLSGFSPEERKVILSEGLKQQGKEKQQTREQQFLSELFRGKQPGQQQGFSDSLMQESGEEGGVSGGFDSSMLSDENIAKATVVNPNLGKVFQSQKDVGLREKRKTEEAERKQFTEDRAYHTQQAKTAKEEADLLRTTIPRKENALQYARDSIETGDVGYFSADKLADATGIDLFRTAKGAQLITAGKENLLNNMGRV